MLIHTGFDVLAMALSLVATIFVYHWRLGDAALGLQQGGGGYVAALIIGAVFGGYGFGTLNLWLSGIDGIGRSIVGAFLGAVIFIEIFKKLRGITGSTGLIFVVGFSVSVAVGRLGCFFSGLDDQTYGIAGDVPWAVDFGDGMMRHPVQLYESLSMVLFAALAVLLLHRRQAFFMANGFYLLAIFYGLQRFCWEFLKPYGLVISSFNIFHFVCGALITYGIWMIFLKKTPKGATKTAQSVP